MYWQIPEEAKNFMAYDYAEFKDLCKQFLTLVSGILVFSVTFAEKIGSLKTVARWPLLISWVSFVTAIVLCGLGLAEMALAGGQAVYGATDYAYRPLESKSVSLAIAAGVSFIVGLSTLVLSGIVSMFSKQST